MERFTVTVTEQDGQTATLGMTRTLAEADTVARAHLAARRGDFAHYSFTVSDHPTIGKAAETADYALAIGSGYGGPTYRIVRTVPATV